MMTIDERERAALEVLKSTGMDVLEAALVAKEALECGRGRVGRARECVRLGAEQLRLRERMETFAKAEGTALEDRKRKGLMARSIVDFRYLCKRMMKLNPGLAEHREMQLSLHLMLYCGIRPTEVSRIDPDRDIDWEHAQVLVRPTTSKTGGGRVVPLRKAACWGREAARPWRQDVCRHTFATYHAAHFRNFPALQMEMGHRDSSLLRTRYVYAGNDAEASALRYFHV